MIMKKIYMTPSITSNMLVEIEKVLAGSEEIYKVKSASVDNDQSVAFGMRGDAEIANEGDDWDFGARERGGDYGSLW